MEGKTISQTPVKWCNRDWQAYLTLFIAGYFFVGGYSFGAENRGLNAGTVNFWRGFSTLLLNWIIVRIQDKSLEFRNRVDLSLLNERSCYCTIHGIMMSVALYYLPPPSVHTINASGPILVFVIDYLRNGTPVSQRQLWGIFTATIGILLTINAVVILEWMGLKYDTPSHFNYINSSASVKSLVSGLLFLCQIIWAYAVVLTKSIKAANAYQIGFHFGFVQVIGGLLAGVWIGVPNFSFLEEAKVFLLVSIPLGIANVLLTVALTMTKKTGNLTMVMFNNVVTGYFISTFRYDEKLNWLALLGSACIFLGLFFVLIR